MPETEQVRLLTLVVSELRVANSSQTAASDTMRATFDTQHDTLVALGESMPTSRVMEVGKVGKPPELWGTNDEVKKKSKDWVYIFLNLLCTVHPKCAKIALKWAADKNRFPIIAKDIID